MPSVIAYYIILLSVPSPAMLQADQAFVQAVDAADQAALEKLLDADFTWTDFQGKIHTRAEVLRHIGPGLIRAREQTASKQYAYGELGDVQENLGRSHVLRVWVKRPGGWRAIVYQEVMSLDTPPSFAPGAGKNCENPCQAVPYQPKNTTEQQVVTAYSKLETAAMSHNSAVFGTLVADEFVAASSNSNKLYDKRGRMEDFDHAKMAGVAPTPLVSARMFDFGDCSSDDVRAQARSWKTPARYSRMGEAQRKLDGDSELPNLHRRTERCKVGPCRVEENFCRRDLRQPSCPWW